MHKFKSILLGSIIGLAVGVSLSTFLFDSLFKSIFPKIYTSSFAFDSYVTSILIIISMLVLGGIMGWIISILKKESAPSTKLSGGIWTFLILLVIVLIGFYAFSFTTTYECEVKTRGEVQLKDSCYSIKLICDKISDQNSKYKDSCYSKLAESKKDSEICAQILDLDKRNICVALIFGKLAVQESSPEKCELITNQDDKDFCYYVIASDVGWKNPEICEKIFDQNTKNNCYFTVGIQLCDESMCEKIIDIVDGNLKINCLDAIDRDKEDEHRPGGSCRFFQEEREKLLKNIN